MSEKTAIEKMVEWLEKNTRYYEMVGALHEARRLALEEAKEKPTELCQTCGDEAPCLCEKPTHIRIDEPHPLPELGTIKPLMRPTAPASLVEEIRKWSSNCYRRGPDGEPDGCLGMMELESILSRYHPSTQADIVGELRALISRRYTNGVRGAWGDDIEEIIAKYEGAK